MMSATQDLVALGFTEIEAKAADAKEVVLFDLFPWPFGVLADALADAARRGVIVGGIGYGETPSVRGVQTWAHPWQLVKNSWPGQQLTIIRDAAECLIALIARSGEEVRHAMWTDSVYLSCLHHGGLACEIQVAAKKRESTDPIVNCCPAQRRQLRFTRPRMSLYISIPLALALSCVAAMAAPTTRPQSLPQLESGAASTTKISHMATVREDLQLHYLDWGGQGPPVLLLAGLGDTAYIFAEAAPKLKSSYRVIALTRRGYGESDVTPQGYTIEDRVEDIRALADKLQLSKFFLVGHSAAGDELTAFAQKYPTRLLGLLYVDAAYDRADPATPKPHMDAWQKVAAELYGRPEAETFVSRETRRQALRTLFRSEYGVSWNQALELNFLETTTENADGSLSPRTPWWVADSIRKGGRSNPFNIPYKSVPTLLVFARGRLEEQPAVIRDKEALGVIEKDEDDYGVYFDGYVQQLMRREPGLRIRILPKDRHYFFLRDPESLTRLLSELRTR